MPDTATPRFTLPSNNNCFAALAADGLAICTTSVYQKLTTFPAKLAVVDANNFAQNFLRGVAAEIFSTHTPHDRCNAVMALLAAQQLSGLDLTQLVPHLSSWRGLPYRLQLVGHLDGQAVINDAKATDMAATLAALQAQTAPVLLICGGAAEEAQQLLAQRKKIAGLLAFGTQRQQLYAQLHTHCQVQQYTDLAAVLAQLQHPRLRVPLLFSPACVSQPEFASFEVRGKFFDDTLGKMKQFQPTVRAPQAV